MYFKGNLVLQVPFLPSKTLMFYQMTLKIKRIMQEVHDRPDKVHQHDGNDEPQRAIASFIILVGQDVMQSIAEQCKFCNDQRDQKWEKFHNLIHSLSPFRRFPHRSRDNRNRYRSVYGVSACVLPKTLP